MRKREGERERKKDIFAQPMLRCTYTLFFRWFLNRETSCISLCRCMYTCVYPSICLECLENQRVESNRDCLSLYVYLYLSRSLSRYLFYLSVSCYLFLLLFRSLRYNPPLCTYTKTPAILLSVYFSLRRQTKSFLCVQMHSAAWHLFSLCYLFSLEKAWATFEGASEKRRSYAFSEKIQNADEEILARKRTKKKKRESVKLTR